MDTNRWLIQLRERRFWRFDFDDLSPAEQVVRAIWELEADVNNGGFEQYFFNSSGDTAFAVIGALEEIGARSAARIAAKANAVFPGSIPPRDRAKRQTLLLAFGPEKEELLNGLDEEFFQYPDDLTELLYEYVMKHAAEIRGVAEVDP